MNKAELRAIYRQIRLRMSKSEVNSNSRIINQKLLDETPWHKVNSLLAYWPISKLNEVKLALPVIEGIEIDFISNDKHQQLPEKKYDLIIVPTLAFDKDNYRLGWGGGFYDRLLAAQPQALKIGLCFANGFVEDGLPHEPHDIPLDKIITEI